MLPLHPPWELHTAHPSRGAELGLGILCRFPVLQRNNVGRRLWKENLENKGLNKEIRREKIKFEKSSFQTDILFKSLNYTLLERT